MVVELIFHGRENDIGSQLLRYQSRLTNHRLVLRDMYMMKRPIERDIVNIL